MSTWDDKPNDYEHALQIIERLLSALREARAELPNPGKYKVNEVWAITCIREAVEIMDHALEQKVDETKNST